MKISVRLAWTIHSMQGAKNFDIFCCERGKSHIDARTGGDARTGPWLYMYCLGPVLVTPPVHVTQGSSSPLQSISAILFATYINYILPSYSLWNLRLSWMFLLKILLLQESIWCKFRSFEFFCTLFKYFWDQVAYMAPWELNLYTYMLIFDHNMQKEWSYEVKYLLEKSCFVVSPISFWWAA